MIRTIRSSSRRARRCPGAGAGTVLLMVAAVLLPVAGQAAPAANGPSFGAELRPEGKAFFRIEQFPARFGQVRPALAPTPTRTPRSGLAAIGTPLLTAGTLLHSAFVDALDPTSGLARPALLPAGSTGQPAEPSFFARSYGIDPGFDQSFGENIGQEVGQEVGQAIGPDIARDIDGSSAFRLIDSERRAAASSAPVLGVRIGERTSLRVQMGGMETREEDGFAGGLRFEYVP